MVAANQNNNNNNNNNPQDDGLDLAGVEQDRMLADDEAGLVRGQEARVDLVHVPGAGGAPQGLLALLQREEAVRGPLGNPRAGEGRGGGRRRGVGRRRRR